jgi:hypothetical protein
MDQILADIEFGQRLRKGPIGTIVSRNADVVHPDRIAQERMAIYRESLAMASHDPQEFIFRTVKGVQARNAMLDHFAKRTVQDQNGVQTSTTVI